MNRERIKTYLMLDGLGALLIGSSIGFDFAGVPFLSYKSLIPFFAGLVISIYFNKKLWKEIDSKSK